MKRRDFLRTAGYAGLTLPMIRQAVAAPCPPPALRVTGGTSVTTSCGSAGTTALATEVNAMAVNEWRTFATTFPPNSGDFWCPDPSTEGILDFAHNGFYDPVRKKLFFVGAGYGGICGYVVYDETTNTWARTVLGFSIIHGWDHLAYDASRGLLYFSSELGGTLQRITVDTGAVTSDGSMPFSGVDTYGMEYWPSLDSIVVSDRSGEVYVRPNGGSFSSLVTGGPTLGYDQMLSHDPVRDVMYWGGGNGTETVFREVTRGRAITTLSNAYRLYVGGTVSICGDQTGHCVVLDGAAGSSPRQSVYRNGQGWSTLSSTVPAAITRNVVGVALHGFPGREVFMYLTADVNLKPTVTVHLYRYS